tara:strand:+ start:21680 stop:22900 length:1221 start_codon:yes stop_codon:yes gene_type:complete
MKIDFSPPFINSEIIREVNDVLLSGWITTGAKTKELEDLIAKLYSIESCLGVSSWTAGAIMFLKWWGVKEGDEVIIPSYTYAATALAVLHVGAKPIMLDVDSDFNLATNMIREHINERTKVIMPVDIAGRMADYGEIFNIVNDPIIQSVFKSGSVRQEKLGRILVLADAAHSIGAKRDNIFSGAYADITIFSLHAVKNITAGEGGIICLNLPKPFDNKKLYTDLKRFSLNGQTKDAFAKSRGGSWEYDIVEQGFKCNMADLNAALALGQLKIYDQLLEERNRVYSRYVKNLKDLDWTILPEEMKLGSVSSNHIFMLRVKDTMITRNLLIKYSAENEISLNVHFKPLQELELFKKYRKNTVYINSKSLYEQEISLPIYPQLSNDEVDYITDVLVEGMRLIKSGVYVD